MTASDPPESDRALEQLLRDNRQGPPGPGQVTPWDFMRGWSEDYVAHHVWPLVSRLLVDDDEYVRARSMEFAGGWLEGRAVAPPLLLDVAEQRPELFGPQEVEGSTLRMQLASALAGVATSLDGPRVARAILGLVAEEPRWKDVASVVARFEPMRMGEHVKALGGREADTARTAAEVIAMLRRDDLIEYLQALRGLSESKRSEIFAVVERAISRDDAKAAQMAKVFGLLPPRRAAPSEAECREALGL